MNKRFFVLLLGIILVASFCFVANADNGEQKSGLFTYKLKGNGTAIITKMDWANNKNADVYVPRMVDGYTVTEIGEYAFSDQEKTQDFDTKVGQGVVVILPDTISVIGEKAFFCTNVTSVSIPASVQFIGSGAFAGCPNIKQYALEPGNPIYTTIDGVLYNKTNKELVSVPFGYPDFDKKAFSIPEGIASIGDYAFAGLECGEGDNKEVIIPHSVTNIGNYSFYKFDTHYRYNRGEHVLDIKNVVKIGEGAFKEAKIGKIVTENIKEIGNNAFENACVDFEEGQVDIWPFKMVQIIGDGAFRDCLFMIETNMYKKTPNCSIELPETLRDLGKYAFYGFSTNHDVDCSITVSCPKLTKIPEYAFYHCCAKRMSLSGNSLDEIGDYALSHIGVEENNNYLNFDEVSFYLSPSIEKIGDHAFDYSSVKISFGESSNLKTIGAYAFDHVYFWTNGGKFTLPDGVEEIGDNCMNMYELKTIVIPSSVKKIGSSICDRSETTLEVEAGSYAYLYAYENGYPFVISGNEDTSWLNN